MLNNAKAHIIKYKLEDGTWVTIPVVVSDMYTAYKAYCLNNNIEPVDQTTYFQTIGNLKELVEQFADNSENIQSVADALAGGVLPLTKGGLGISIGAGQKYTTLRAALTDREDGGYGVGLATYDDLLYIRDAICTRYDAGLDSKINNTAFASGTDTPDKANLSSDVMFYFQVKE